MIIKCPNCSFEQPLEGDYCLNCGGELEKLLAEEKKRRKQEHIRTKLLLITLFSVLLVGYVLIFYNSDSTISKNSFIQNTSDNAINNKPLKTNPSKIVNRAEAPSLSEESKIHSKPAEFLKKNQAQPVSASNIKKSLASKKKNEIEKSNSTQIDATIKKNIKNLQLLDRFNCGNLKVKILLNDSETKNLLNCSQVVVSDIDPKETFVLEEGKAAIVSMSLYLSESLLEVIMTVVIDNTPISYNYFYNLPQIKESTASIAFPIGLKDPPPDLNKIIEDSSVLPLFFKDKRSGIPPGWSSLFFHATF